MRSLWAFSALLLIAWPRLSQASYGRERNVRDIPVTDGSPDEAIEKMFEGAQGTSNGRVVTATGAEVPVSELILFYEGLKNAPEVKYSNKCDYIPPAPQLEAILANGGNFDPTPMCRITNKVEFTKPYPQLHKIVCNDNQGNLYDPNSPLCDIKREPELTKTYDDWYEELCDDDGDEEDADSFVCNLKDKSEFTRPDQWEYIHVCDGTEDKDDSEESEDESPATTTVSSSCTFKVTSENAAPYEFYRNKMCTSEHDHHNPICAINIEITTTTVVETQQPKKKKKKKSWFPNFFKVFCLGSPDVDD